LQAFNRGDYSGARNIWQRLARDNDTFAQYGLGKLYETGSGITQDYEAAAIWYEKAALQNSPYAQGSLALLYSYGRGVSINLPRAHALSILAAEGYGRWALELQKAALTNAEILVRHMTPEQRQLAAAELRDWRSSILEGVAASQKGAFAKRPQ
jgi:TPR repeat protein